MNKPKTTTGDTRPGVTIEMPSTRYPSVCIPFNIASDWMKYGRIGYEDHKSEWGCAVKLHRDEENHVVHVVEWEPYKIDARSAYWESIEGERQRHANELIAAGKEDELVLWNGLFHTHPIGSGASMSGTDVEQLKEMASGGNWALSIISPANRDGEVIENKFMAHYADSRDIGMVVVSNLKPKIGSRPKTDELEVIREHMKDLMVKVEKPKPKNNNYRYQASESDKVWDEKTRRLIDRDPDKVYPQRYKNGARDVPRKGDFIYIQRLDMGTYNTAPLEKEEVKELERLEGRIVQVYEIERDGRIVIDGTMADVKTNWILDPKSFHSSFWGDDILVVSRNGSLDSKVLERGVKQGLKAEELGFVTKMLTEAGIKPLEIEEKSTTTVV